MKARYILFILLLSLGACKTFEAGHFDFPTPVDTSTKPIMVQEKVEKSFSEAGLYLDNQFEGGRMNSVTLIDDNFVRVTILPENEPINPSPFYAFRIWSDVEKVITLELNYLENKHRYYPKLSENGTDWKRISSDAVKVSPDSKSALLTLNLTPKKLWVSGQELMTSTYTKTWCEKLSADSRVQLISIGESKLGRELLCMDIFSETKEKKETILIISRQHPPEVTGFMAMQAFVEELLADKPLSKNFIKKYRVIVFPLLNPDGVDMGHWRHNAGGIDLNRDWAYFRQPETRQVSDYMVAETKKSKNKVILGLDFHSTNRDIYYTHDESMPSIIHGFKDYWLSGIDDAFDKYKPEDAPRPIGQPISKGWFYLQFGAESITYEIGDETPRKFINDKARVAAKEMMKLLILRNQNK